MKLSLKNLNFFLFDKNINNSVLIYVFEAITEFEILLPDKKKSFRFFLEK